MVLIETGMTAYFVSKPSDSWSPRTQRIWLTGRECLTLVD